MHRTLLAVWLVLAMALTACSAIPQSLLRNGTKAVERTSQPAAPDESIRTNLTVTAIIPSGGAPDFSKVYRNFHLRPGAHYGRAPLAKGTQLYAYAYYFPSYASPRVGYWNGTVTLKNGTVTVPFTNLIAANNALVYVNLYTNDVTGGGVYVGTLAGVVNVTKRSTALALTRATSLIYQGVDVLEEYGLVTAQDLKKPGFATGVAKLLKKSGLKPSPQSGVYTVAQLVAFEQAVAPQFQRTLTIDGGPTATMISIANNPADVADTNVAFNTQAFLVDGTLSALKPPGYPCFNTLGGHTPGKKTALLSKVCATLFTTGTGTVTTSVFGGGLRLGTTNGVAPFTGVTSAASGGAPGAKSIVTLTQAATQISLTTSDPYDWAFGLVPASPILSQALLHATPIALGTVGTNAFNQFDKLVQVSIPPTYSQASPIISVNAWNPWGVPVTNFTLCSIPAQTALCTGSPGAGTFAIAEYFADNGTNGAYFNWQAGSPSALAFDSSCGGYQLTPSAGTIVMSTTTPSYLSQAQQIQLVFANCGGGSKPAAGSQAVVTASDAAGNIYSGLGTMSGSSIKVNLNATQTTAITALSVKITLAAGSPSKIFLSGLL